MPLKDDIRKTIREHMQSCIEDLQYIRTVMQLPQYAEFFLREFDKELEELRFFGMEFNSNTHPKTEIKN